MEIRLIKNMGEFKVYAKYNDRRVIVDGAPKMDKNSAQMWYLGKKRIVYVQSNAPKTRYPFSVIQIHSNREGVEEGERIQHFADLIQAEQYASRLVKQ